jgi:DNA primase
MTSPTIEIKEKLDIVEVVGSYLKLEKAGQNYKAKCPFHNEKTPSFFVSPKRNSFYCFGCGAKGDIFSFVEQFENLDFIGALKILAERAGVKLNFESKEKRDEKERIFNCIDLASSFFEKNLKKNKTALDYLHERGLSDETIKNWRIGFAEDAWHSLEENLIASGFTKDEMMRAGVIKSGEGGKIYDTFRNRIMFPIFDNAKRVIAFSGRIFGDEKDVAKYLNSPETEIFKKSEVLYGLHVAKNGIRKLGFAILVEGQMDLLMSQQAGWENTVASSGTALTNDQLLILKRLTPNLIIAYDNDNAGIKASQKAFEMALAIGFNVKAIKTPGDKDPADLILKDKDLWKKSIKEAKHIVAYAWQNLLEQKLPREKFISRVRTVIFPLLASVPGNSEKMRLVSEYKISVETGIKEEYILEEIIKVAPEYSYKEIDHKKVEEKENSVLRKLFGAIFSLENKKGVSDKQSDISKNLKEILGVDFEKIKIDYEKEKDRLIFEFEAGYGSGEIDKNELNELFKNVEEDILRQKMLEKIRLLKTAEEKRDAEEIKKILTECQVITTKLEKLKNNP